MKKINLLSFCNIDDLFDVKTKSMNERSRFYYTQILENHPGIYNDKDPDFSDNLKNFIQQQKSTIKEASINLT